MKYIMSDFLDYIHPRVQQVCNNYGIHGTLEVSGYQTFTLTLLPGGALNFIGNLAKHSPTMATNDMFGCLSVNFYTPERQFDGVCLQCVRELIQALRWCSAAIEASNNSWYDGYMVYMKIMPSKTPY
jgi:hypothetical protein